MNAKYRTGNEIVRDKVDWGELGWISRPADTQAKSITEILVTLEPGFAHNFHLHPRQEEVIYVMEGEVEQWLETGKRILKAGDAVFVGPGVVHATFNVGKQTAKFLVVLAPCVGDAGYEIEEVADKAPWNSLRKQEGRV